MALDNIADMHDFGPWRQKFNALFCQGDITGQKVILFKPMNFMNLSGQAVGEIIRFYKVKNTDIAVFYDEIDLEAGKVRLKNGGGHAGHNGVRSLCAHIGADFTRVRIGVGHPGDKAQVNGWVLSDFSTADSQLLTPVLVALAQNINKLIEGKHTSYMNKVVLSSS